MRQEFVEYFSPGTLVSEVTRRQIDSRDVERAKAMARDIKERHGATPFGFRFIARERADDEMDGHDVDPSNMYYLGGKVETLADVEARATDDDEILLRNMRCNEYSRIITNTNSWKITLPLEEDDVVLDWRS